MADKAPVTIRDVARSAGVSVGTASNVLANKSSVSPDLCDRVLAAAQAMGYRRNDLAAGLKRRNTRTLGLCIPNFANPFFVELIQTLQARCEAEGYELLVIETGEDGRREHQKLETLYQKQVDGVFMVPTADWAGQIDERIAHVVVDRTRKDEPLPSVALDNAGAMHEAVRYLSSLGHQRIWLVVNSSRLRNAVLRRDGFLQAVADFGISPEARVIEVGMDPAQIATQVCHFLDTQRHPTAIVSASGLATLGTLRALQDRTLSIPDDISVLALDDAAWMDVLRPAITVIRQPVEAMAHEAWLMMHSLLKGQALARKRVRLEGALLVRESIRPPGPETGPPRTTSQRATTYSGGCKVDVDS